MFTHLRIEESDSGATRVTMDRPPANALNDELNAELSAAVDHLIERNPRVVVLASAQPMFMAGADLGNVNVSWGQISTKVAEFQATGNKWERLPMPTIALINGHALGAGCEMSLVCDWRIMARGRGRIGLPEVRRGLLAGGGGTQRTTRMLGRARALDLNMRGLMIDADEAYRIGLISEVCDPDDLEARGQALVDELLGLPRMSLAAIKRCILEGGELDLTAGLKVEQREMTALGETEDTREGVQSFLEKRDPDWVHR
jgi:enoyl-CoA hydratase/carnithine racemase